MKGKRASALFCLAEPCTENTTPSATYWSKYMTYLGAAETEVAAATAARVDKRILVYTATESQGLERKMRVDA